MYKILVFLFFSTVYAQIQHDGKCSYNFTYEKSLDVTKLLGTWHEIERIPNSDQTGECATNIITVLNNTLIQMNNTEVVNHKPVTRLGIIVPSADSGIYKLSYADGTLDLLILGTNYNEYLMLYGCKNILNGSNYHNTVTAWKLSRNTTLSTTATQTLSSLANTTGLNVNWKTVSHSTDACKISGASNLQISPIILLVFGLISISFATKA